MVVHISLYGRTHKCGKNVIMCMCVCASVCMFVCAGMRERSVGMHCMSDYTHYLSARVCVRVYVCVCTCSPVQRRGGGRAGIKAY